MKQSALTLVTPIKPGQESNVDIILKGIRQDLDIGSFKLFDEIGTIHYARFVVLKDQLSNSKANLVFSSDYDGLLDEHLLIICNKGQAIIDELYGCCEGYPQPADRSDLSRKSYLFNHAIKEASFYIGAPGRTVEQIRKESSLRNFIWNMLHTNKWDSKSPVEVIHSVKQQVLANPQYQWVNDRVQLPRVKFLGRPLVQIILILVLFPITIPLLLFAGICILIIHFRYEKTDVPLGKTPSQIDESKLKELEEYEDVHYQNQFTQIIEMKPGKFRLYTLKALMAYARFRVSTEFRLGKLMGIPTIHFARWVIFDNNKQVLFFSNFDGSWQQYLGDFIDKSGWGLTAIFSNTKDFPKTRFLFMGGAYDEEHFLAWARYTQVPTAVWYCAYPHLSIKNINNNSAIRVDLMNNFNEEQAQNYLNRF